MECDNMVIDYGGRDPQSLKKNVLWQIFNLDMKGCICHLLAMECDNMVIDYGGRDPQSLKKNVLWQIFNLDMKGCICHFVKWQIHPFISKGTMYWQTGAMYWQKRKW